MTGYAHLKQGCFRRLWGCFLFGFLFFIFFCLLLAWAVKETQAQSAQPLSVYLLIDNSNSMFEKEGIGSDPDLLRLDAARLFLSYLGIDSQTIHRCGIIFFGSQAQVIAPLTPLTDQQRRDEIFSLLVDPPRMAWTDHVAALQLAFSQLQTETPNGRSVIILLTDGKPEWDNTPTAEETAEYRQQLTGISDQLAEAGIPLFIILLANEATDADPEIRQVWQPAWQQITAVTAPGQFFTARQATELVGIYHEIVVRLTDGQTDGPVLQAVANPAGVEKTLLIEPHLLRLTLVISKSDPATQVTVIRPDGKTLTAVSPTVHYAGQPGLTTEEVWAIDTPPPGQWVVRLTGEGQVTVWKDYEIIPITPSATAFPTSTETAVSTPTFSPSSTPLPVSTPLPIILQPASTRPKEDGVPTKIEGLATPGSSHWLWGIPVVLSVLVGGGYGWWRQVAHRPMVSGVLRVLPGPNTTDGTTVIDLDTLSCPQVTVGTPPADIVLSGATGQVTIYPGAAVGDTYQLLITGSGQVYLDGEPLTTSRTLVDAAIITLGVPPGPLHRLQYENLRLRAAQLDKVIEPPTPHMTW